MECTDLEASDEVWMAHALALARRAAELGEAPVGAVLVHTASGDIRAESGNAPIAQSDPTAHAEILAIRKAAKAAGNYRLEPGLTLYVTLEPCAMCAGAISHARVSRVVYGATDAKGGAVESGPRYFAQPTCHWRPEVRGGVLAEEAAALLKTFFRERRGGSEPAARPAQSDP
jgi:tRNA(Arg) A34 adenosine deaminase TadA